MKELLRMLKPARVHVPTDYSCSALVTSSDGEREVISK